MRTTVQAAAAVLLLALPGVASGQGAAAALSMPFKATTPATETGVTLDLRYYNAENRDEKPPTISKLALRLPAGTRIDPSAVPVCEASNEDLQARGRDACPPETQVGTGKLDVYLGGPGDPQTTDVALFNGPGQIIELVLFEGTNNTAALERLRVEGSTISGEPVQVPPGAPPDRRFSASRIVWDIPARGGYLVTPSACPDEGLWRVSGEFEFADGSTAKAASTQPCTRPAAPPAVEPAPAAVRVTATPRRIVRGRRTRIRVRLISTDPACVRGATIRVGRRATRTDGEGRARMRILVRYLERPRVRAETSCGRAFTRLYGLPW